MIAKIYVAGELLERFPPGRGGPTRLLYDRLQSMLTSRGYSVQLPTLDPVLNEMDAEAFFAEVSRRIEKVDFVVTVIGRRSSSPPVEAAIASQQQKKQIILTPPGSRPSRMLAGLPFVIAIGKHSEMQSLID